MARFVPGFAAVATTLAGQARTDAARFALYAGIDTALWATFAAVLGAVFHEAVREVLAQLELPGLVGLILLLAVVTLFIAGKAGKRQRFIRLIRMERISAPGLQRLIESGGAPLVLDVRPPDQRALAGWIPGAILVSRVEGPALAPRHEIVIYCACPTRLRPPVSRAS